MVNHNATPLNQYAVFGHPINHSLSPKIHTRFAELTGRHVNYQAIDVHPDDFLQAIHHFQNQGGAGLNITVPLKNLAWNAATVRTKYAEIAGAVNTLTFKESALIGDNTDGPGLLKDLQRIGFYPQGKRILILGAGGAAMGIIGPLLEHNPTLIHVANRTIEKAHALTDRFQKMGPISSGGFDNLTDQTQFHLIINATASSLHKQKIALPEHIAGTETIAYDLMYSKYPTVFMNWARNQGAQQILDGLGMLIEQAAESFQIWHGIRPPTDPLHKEARLWLTN